MNNKEFLAELGTRTGQTSKDAASLAASLASLLTKELVDENTVVVPGFGCFDVKKKLERVVVNPATKQRMLVPPKMVAGFRPAGTLKDKVNGKQPTP